MVGRHKGGRIKPTHGGTDGETFEIDDDPMAISMNTQKQDDSSEEPTIRILQDGESRLRAINDCREPSSLLFSQFYSETRL